jgi:flagellar motor protein MotB
MRAVAAPRWAISFADLGLILLGCFVMLHALSGGVRPSIQALAAPALREFAAEDLFEPDDARLTPQGRALLREFGRGERERRLILASRGTGASSARLDAFELAAARAAAVARTLRAAGATDIELRMDSASRLSEGQKIGISHGR